MAAAARALNISSSHFKRLINSTNPATIERVKAAAIRYKENIK
jgi:hypothetical protein